MNPNFQLPVPAALRIAFRSATLIAGLALQLHVAGAGDDHVTQLPAAVDAAIEAMVPDYVLERAKRERENGTFVYEIKGTGNGMEFEMEITASGVVLESEFEDDEEDDDDDDDREKVDNTIPLDWLPSAVATTLNEVASGMKVTDAERKGRRNRYYEFEGTLDGVEIEVRIASNGTLLKIERDGIGSRERENTVPAEWLPDAVVSTLEEEYPDLSIDAIRIASIDHEIVYEIEGTVGSKRIELYISPAGQVVRYEMDSDDDGLADTDESDIGCDPDRADTDGDAFPDGFETSHGSDPLNPGATPEILSIDLLRGADGDGDSVVLTVSTFHGGVFALEHCPAAQDWTSLGISITGDDASHEIRIPVDDPDTCGFFRVTMSELSAEKEKPIGGGSGTTETGFAPDNLENTDFDIKMGDDAGKELQFRSGLRGQLVERKGRRIEVEPFRYRYERTGDSTARVTVTFPRWGEDRVIEYELEFTADGKGSVVSSSPGGVDTGSFSYHKSSGGWNGD